MMQRPYELLARFGTDGNVAGVSVRHITTFNGRDYEGDPQPLSGTDDPAFAVFSDAFSSAVVAERDTLKTDKATLTTELATANATIATRDATIAQHETTIADLQEQLSACTTERADMQVQIDRLTALVPPPAADYEVTRSEFLARLQAVDASIIIDIWKAQSPEAIMAAVALFTHDGLVDLRPNSRTHQMLQSLVPLGIITEEQVQSLLVEG